MSSPPPSKRLCEVKTESLVAKFDNLDTAERQLFRQASTRCMVDAILANCKGDESVEAAAVLREGYHRAMESYQSKDPLWRETFVECGRRLVEALGIPHTDTREQGALRVVHKTNDLRAFTDVILIGRGSFCDLSIRQSRLSPSISRVQLVVFCSPRLPRILVVDIASINGTRVLQRGVGTDMQGVCPLAEFAIRGGRRVLQFEHGERFDLRVGESDHLHFNHKPPPGPPAETRKRKLET